MIRFIYVLFRKIDMKKIAIIGCGALGSAAARLLAKKDFELSIIDRDIVDESNLRISFKEADLGKLKTEAVKNELKKINPKIKVRDYCMDLDFENISLLKNAELIIDCTDNLETRFLINEFCMKNKINWIYGAVIRNKGYVYNIIPRADKGCFKCIFREAEGLETCETAGVSGSIVDLIASVQVSEALKILNNRSYEKEMLYFNLDKNEFRKIKVNKRKNCEVCNGRYEYLEGKKKNIVKFCGSGMYQIKGKFKFNEVKRILNVKGKDFLRYKNMIIFKDRALIKTKSEREAKIIYSKIIGN